MPGEHVVMREPRQILVYGDSLSWGIVPGTRQRLPFAARWPGVMEGELTRAGHVVRVIEDCLNGRRTVWVVGERRRWRHLDADQHERLGRGIAVLVGRLLAEIC